MNNRGVFQIIYVVVFLLLVALISLMFFKMNNTFKDEFLSFEEINNTEYARESIQSVGSQMPYVHDELVLFFFIASVISLIVSAVKTNFNPVVIGLFFILFLLSIFIAAGAVNIYQGMAQSEDLINESGKLIFTNVLFSKFFPLIIMAIGTIVLIIMWGKVGGQEIR
ncbi:MAG: hypothetical protein ACFFG0_07985 [Candidatus Thorarchaeota archaeon]